MITVEFEYTDSSVGYRKRLTHRMILSDDNIKKAQAFFHSIGAYDQQDNSQNVLLMAIVQTVDVDHISKIRIVEYV